MRYRNDAAARLGSSNPAVHHDNGYRRSESLRDEEGRCDDRRRDDNGRRDDHRRKEPCRDLRGEFSQSLGAPERRDSVRAEAQAHQERAHEAALRGCTLSTRPAVASMTPNQAPRVRAQEPPRAPRLTPDLCAAARDAAGHPRFPIAAVPDDESDWGASEDESTNEEKPNLKKFRTHEELRLRNVRDVPQPPPKLQTGPANAGPFASLHFDTVKQVCNLIRWMSAGSEEARAQWQHLTRFFAANAGARRNDGAQYLMRRQQEAERGWLVATTGNPTPQSRRGPGKTHNQRRHEKKRLGRSNSAVPDSDAATMTSSSDIHMAPPESDDEIPFQRSYLGNSPLPQIPFTENRGPEIDLRVVLRYAATQRPHLWVQGIRTTDGSWPTLDDPAGTPALVGDLLSARFANFIGPERGTGPSSIHRARFMETLFTGFSVFGLFERMVMLGQWEYAELPLEHYPFDATNITLSQVFAWVYTHGIATGTTAAAHLHAYAQSWRNRRLNLELGNAEFGDFPCNARDVLNVNMPSITSWCNLYYGPPQSGITTATHSSPSQINTLHPPPAITPTADSEMPMVEDTTASTSVIEVEAGEIVPSQVPLPESPVRNSPYSPETGPDDVTSDGGPDNTTPKISIPRPLYSPHNGKKQAITRERGAYPRSLAGNYQIVPLIAKIQEVESWT
ncbi:hypothetical protein B0H17DRAFT_1147555 [Mycena rosella]|uniref:Uncharacterized protein n=1 Tax=Mycena rosella TaxID=1033263 RepID=A0AAD7G029_MYCRO|nr:hypothetical protein B0H17DRAFT_1147555 [Mycena rosella]